MKISFIIPFKGSDTELSLLISDNRAIVDTNHEIIVIYDGNSNVKGRCSENVHIVESEYDGVYQSMNFGIKIASGDYLFFLGQTDKINWDNINLLNDTTCDVCILKYKIDERVRSNVPRKSYIYHHQSLLFSAEFLKKNKIQYSVKYNIHSDYDFIIRALKKAKSIKELNFYLCKFERGGISNNRKKILSSIYEIYQIQHANNIFDLLDFSSIAFRKLSYIIR